MAETEAGVDHQATLLLVMVDRGRWWRTGAREAGRRQMARTRMQVADGRRVLAKAGGRNQVTGSKWWQVADLWIFLLVLVAGQVSRVGS